MHPLFPYTTTFRSRPWTGLPLLDAGWRPMRSPTRRSPRSCARSSSTACVTPRRRRGMTERAVAARAALAESSPSEGRGLLLGLIGVAVFSLTLPMTRLAMADSDPVVFGLGQIGRAHV